MASVQEVITSIRCLKPSAAFVEVCDVRRPMLAIPVGQVNFKKIFTYKDYKDVREWLDECRHFLSSSDQPPPSVNWMNQVYESSSFTFFIFQWLLRMTNFVLCLMIVSSLQAYLEGGSSGIVQLALSSFYSRVAEKLELEITPGWEEQNAQELKCQMNTHDCLPIEVCATLFFHFISHTLGTFYLFLFLTSFHLLVSRAWHGDDRQQEQSLLRQRKVEINTVFVIFYSYYLSER